MIEGLLDDFIAETREMLHEIGGELVAWEQNPEERERLDAIFRFIHTVKGNSGLFDFPRLQSLSHAAEDALAEVRAGHRAIDPALVSAVLAVVDRIGDFMDGIEADGVVPQGDDSLLISYLNADAISEASEIPALPGDPDTPKSNKRANKGSIRLPVALLDRMMNRVSDIALARNELAKELSEVGGPTGAGSPFERLSAMIGDVSEMMTHSRMRSIEVLFGTFSRLVRDLATQLGKHVTLDTDGGDVELDREMIEAIRDPLLHIIRNAIDHGIEAPDQRAAAGKPANGMLRIAARQSGNQIYIDIADDGKGFDADALVDKAVSAGLIEKSAAQNLSMQEKYQLACLPGLSTAQETTDVSGRGVGMDIVSHNVERIGGAIELASEPGEGTRVTMRIPLTLTITPVLLVGVGEQQFAITRSYVAEVIRSGQSGTELNRVGSALVVRHRDGHLPCLSLSQLMGVPDASQDPNPVLVVLQPTDSEQIVLAVDWLGDQAELAMRPVAPVIMRTGLYAGAALSDQGVPILLLDVAGLAKLGNLEINKLGRGALLADENASAREVREAPKALVFVDHAGRRRGLRLDAISRIDEVDASAVHQGDSCLRVNIDGELHTLVGASLAELPNGVLRLARVQNGDSSVAYALGQIEDVKPIENAIVPEENSAWLEGVTLIDDKAVSIVDIAKVFQAHRDDRKPLCRLPDGAWAEYFLKPIVEAAGYGVACGDERADVAIVLEDIDPVEARAVQIIHISDDSRDSGSVESAIDRHDREALLGALKAARAGGAK